MNRVVEYQLQRAATEGRSGAIARSVPIKPIADRIVATLNKVYRDKEVSASVAIDGELRFPGDEGDLTELLGNLADNAYKWCAGAVRIAAQRRAGFLTIMVEDDGPGVEGSAAQRILE